MKRTHDLNVEKRELLRSPDELRELLPASEKASQTIIDGRRAVMDILDGKDPRLLMINGPCSIVSKEHALLYGEKMKALADDVKETMLLIKRSYFEKPRTNVGWKGLVNDPDIDNKSFDIDRGLYLAREILLELLEMGVLSATEILSQIAAERYAGLTIWDCIGARSTEDQSHREWASAFSPPTGFKNGTDGDIMVAINAILAASVSQVFTGHDEFGRSCKTTSKGNKYTHIVLRGGKKPNYEFTCIEDVMELICKHGLLEAIVVDCSHKNSRGNYKNQIRVFNDVLTQRTGYQNGIIHEPNPMIKGMMFEVNLQEGKMKNFKYGITPFSDIDPRLSITDACLGWDEFERTIRSAHEILLPHMSIAA